MSIADKLTAVAENVQKVYDAGRAAGGGGENPLQYAKTLAGAFNGVAFPEGYELTIDVPNITSLANAFQNATGLKKITLKGNTAQNAVGMTYGFRSESLEVFDASEFCLKPSIAVYAFNGASSLMTILGEWDMSELSEVSQVNQMFNKCYALQEVGFKAQTLSLSLSFGNSSKLSDESIQSIVDALADMTEQTSPTLTLHATVGAKLTDEQKAAATAKNWTLAY